MDEKVCKKKLLLHVPTFSMLERNEWMDSIHKEDFMPMILFAPAKWSSESDAGD